MIPLVVEHIWEYYSSRQVWQAVGQKDVGKVWRYVKGLRAHDMKSPGAALHLLQDQWDYLENSSYISAIMQASSWKTMLEAAHRMSERSIVTALKPNTNLDGTCHVSCFLASDRLPQIARIVGEYHSGNMPPLIAIQDRAATLELFEPNFCKLAWGSFDPSSLSWTFDAQKYFDRLKKLKPQTFPPLKRSE